MCKAGRRPSPKIKKRNEEIYRLFEIGFRTQSEIAKEYGLSLSTVAKAIASIRKEMADNGNI